MAEIWFFYRCCHGNKILQWIISSKETSTPKKSKTGLFTGLSKEESQIKLTENVKTWMINWIIENKFLKEQHQQSSLYFLQVHHN